MIPFIIGIGAGCDRLFNDFLAIHFVGERGERISSLINDALELQYQIVDFHRIWSAVRTKYINDTISRWLQQHSRRSCQVTNLGCGVDTRAFWLDCLSHCSRYVEVDVVSINDFKTGELSRISDLKAPFCPRQVISMDFGAESVADLPKHGYDARIPTLWILEGLVMYLQRSDAIKMITEIASMSSPGSSVVINYLDSPDKPDTNPSNLDYMEALLVERGWTGTRECFGEKVINYGLFPKVKQPISTMGFGTFFKMR